MINHIFLDTQFHSRSQSVPAFDGSNTERGLHRFVL